MLLAVLACGGNETAPAVERAEPEHVTPEAPVEAAEPEVADPSASWVELLHALPGTWVSASSAYRNDPRQVGRLVDGDLETAWNSFSNVGDAILYVRVPDGAVVHAIEMTVGYTKVQRGRDLFEGNRRIEHVIVREPGQPGQEVRLDPESRELQRIVLDAPIRGGDVEIELADFVSGTSPDWNELCVSELRVLGASNEATPDTRTPMAHLGALPPRDPERFARALLERLRDDLEAPPPALGSPVRGFAGVFTDERNARVEIPLRGGSCYVIVGQAQQRVPDDPGLYPPNIDVAVGDESFTSDVLEPETDIAVGLRREVCPSGSLRAEAVLTGENMASYWLHVFERAAGAGDEDPDELGDDVDALDDERDDADDVGDDGSSDFTLEREGLRLTTLTLGPALESREIVDPRTTFSKASDDRVYCHARLENPDRSATTLYLGWESDDRPIDPDDQSAWGRAMSIPAQPRYVTFGYRGTGQRAGRYRCVIRDEDGVVLGRANYELTE